jgi:hypothetical protein
MKAAENYFQKSLKIFLAHKHPDIFMLFENLATLSLKKSIQFSRNNDIAQSQALKNQAMDYLKKCLGVLKENFPRNSPHIKRIQLKLKENQ